MRESDWRAYEAIRRDQQLINETARWLRHRAIQDGYAGMQRKDVTFALACVFDVMIWHWRDIPDGVRSEIRATCETIAYADLAEHPPTRAPVAPADQGAGPDGRVAPK